MAITEQSFQDKNLREFFFRQKTKGVPENTRKLREILSYIDRIDELPPEGGLYRAHEHQGGGKGTWSFSLTGNFRVLCEFDENCDAFNIRIEDPH
jgi:plasmid maintenance system killer protein